MTLPEGLCMPVCTTYLSSYFSDLACLLRSELA